MQTSGWVSTELPCNCTVSLGGCSKRGIVGSDCLLVGCYNHKDGKYDGGFEVVEVEERKEGGVITKEGGDGGVKMTWREPFGIFDMVVVRWSLMPEWLVESIDVTHRETGDLVLCACTDGAARIYHLEATADGFKRSVILTVQLHDEMLTSATCHTVVPTGETAPQLLMIAASAHKGGLCVAEVKDITGACLRQVVVSAHEFDAWCVAAHPLCSSSEGHASYPLLWTGGDDGKMKLWSSADVLAKGDDSPALYSQLRGFDAGVVTIVPLCIEQHAAASKESNAIPTTSLATFLLIGSYDEHLRCIDVTGLSEFSAPLSSLNEEDGADGEKFSAAAMRAKMFVAASMKRPLFEHHLEGGVWRVRLGEGCTGSHHSTTNNTPVAVLEEGQSSTTIKAAVATMQRGAVALTLEVVTSSNSSACLSVVDESVIHFHEGILGAPAAQSDDKEEQQPLVYDVAFAPSTGAIVSLSFYDRHVALSSSSDAKQE